MEYAKVKEMLLWRFGQVDGKLHTLAEVSQKYGVAISDFALTERALCAGGQTDGR
jgi:hypothetical protein